MSTSRALPSQYTSAQLSTSSVGVTLSPSKLGANILPFPLVICDTSEVGSEMSCGVWYRHPSAVFCPIHSQVILQDADACLGTIDSGLSEQESPSILNTSTIAKTVSDLDDKFTIVRSSSKMSHGCQYQSSHSPHRIGFPVQLDSHKTLSRPLDSEFHGPQQVRLLIIPLFEVVLTGFPGVSGTLLCYRSFRARVMNLTLVGLKTYSEHVI